jgi:hypothetical protein
MVGTQSDGSGSHEPSREEASSTPDSARSPVLSGMSEAELEAIVSKLRTDKNPLIPPTLPVRERLGAVTERLLLSTSRKLDPRQSAAAREEAARHAWYISLGDGVAGPLELAALRAHWERGELGPDSFCWRQGFDGWQLLCRVPALAEFLAPPSQAALTPTNLVPEERCSAPDFLRKGAEALRVLADDAPRPVTLDTRSILPPFLEPEPVTEPAAPAALDPIPAVAQAQGAAGAHPALSGAPPQVEVRIRGGLWLALGGGLVGGLLMACVMWLLGAASGPGSSPRGTSPGLATPSGATALAASAASPAPAGSMGSTGSATVPAATAREPEAQQPAQTGVALAPVTSAPGPGVTAPNPATTAMLPSGEAPSPGVTAPAWTSAPWAPFSVAPLSGVTVPPLGPSGLGSAAVAKVTPASTPTPLVTPAPARSAAAGASRPALAPSHAVVPDPPMRRLAKAETPPRQESPFEARAAPQAKQETLEEEDDFGPDKDFERELAAQRPAAPAPRTVWIPPTPVKAEPPATLAQSDIFAVVLANKGDIASCASAQKSPAVEEGSRVVVRWTILPSGKVTDVATETAGLRNTPLARCLEEKIRTWTFPRHRDQGGPVRFPFVF